MLYQVNSISAQMTDLGHLRLVRWLKCCGIGLLTRFWSNSTLKDKCKQLALLLTALVTILQIMAACIVDTWVGDIAEGSANKWVTFTRAFFNVRVANKHATKDRNVAFVSSDPWTTAHAHTFTHALFQGLPCLPKLKLTHKFYCKSLLLWEGNMYSIKGRQSYILHQHSSCMLRLQGSERAMK